MKGLQILTREKKKPVQNNIFKTFGKMGRNRGHNNM